MQIQSFCVAFAIATVGILAACTNHAEGLQSALLDRPQTNQEAFEWHFSSLDEKGIEPQLLNEMVTEITAEQPDIGISSVVIVYQGGVVFEDYYNEWQPDQLHTTRSASKAITSALVGIAIDQGFLESVDQPVLPFFPEYDGQIDNWDERKRDITIGHILSMTSGVRNNEDNMYPTDDWIKFYLDQPLTADPGTEFSYATSGVVTLGNVITRGSGLRIPAFANKYLFEPLDISQQKWPITNSLGSQGLAMTGGGLHLTPRDMAKFGLLYLNNGRWSGQQIISESWIETSTTRHSISDLYGEDFGYLWRMIDRNVLGQNIRSFEAWGNGGQFIMAFPSLDLVVAWTGENYGKFPEMERPFALTEQYVLPSVIKHRQNAKN